ncbi:hypothetical protein J6590_099105 [Homalodisca vitripennis]|nr:hypothetical protein J6590_099105 [Homalodisca vitripennis]
MTMINSKSCHWCRRPDFLKKAFLKQPGGTYLCCYDVSAPDPRRTHGLYRAAGVRNFTRFAYPPPESQPSFHPMRKCSSFIGGSRNCSALSTCSFATSRCPVQANARAALVLRHSAWRRSLTARVSSVSR